MSRKVPQKILSNAEHSELVKQKVLEAQNYNSSIHGRSTVQKNSTDRLYYNVSIPHNDVQSINGSPTEANFFEVRSNNLFDAPPDEYSMSVVRFTIPTQYIPLTIMPVTVNPSDATDRNYSIYSVTLSYGGSDFTQHIEYIPQAASQPVPPPPTGNDVFRPKYIYYYSIYSVEWMLMLINTALSKAFTALTLVFPPAPTLPTQPPFLTYNPATRLITLNAQITYDSDQLIPYIEIFMNNSLFQLFDASFQVIYYGFQTVNPDKSVKFLVKNNITNNAPSLPVLGASYQMTQEFSTIPNWSPLTNITFTSNSLPIRHEWLSGGNVIQQNNGTTGIVSNIFRPILTDFEIDNGLGFETRTFIHYFPTAEYRRIDLIGKIPIRNIDIQVWWKDNYDNLYPILIPAHDEVSIKILFEKKH